MSWLSTIFGRKTLTTTPLNPLTKSTKFFKGVVIASDPSILKTATGYNLFYTDFNVDTNRTIINRASSTDGLNWTNISNAMSGRTGQWDESTECASVVLSPTGYYMYFSGYRDGSYGFPAALWASWSMDNKTYQRISSDPVMVPTQGWYDNDAIYSPTVIYENGVYKMIYVGHAYTDTSKIPQGGVYLLSATSPDGITWTKGATPIAGPGKLSGWQSEVAEPYLIKKAAGSYLLFYTGISGEERAIGVATATNPAGPWKFGTKPILKKGPAGAADEHQVLAPAAYLNGDQLTLWYLAANKSEALSIGRATGSLQAVLTSSY